MARKLRGHVAGEPLQKLHHDERSDYFCNNVGPGADTSKYMGNPITNGQLA